MAKRQIRSVSTPKPRTQASIAFVENLEGIKHLSDVGYRERILIRSAAARLLSFGKSVLQSHDLKDSSAVKKNLAALAKLQRSSTRFGKTLDTRLARLRTLTLWQVVMLVTCVEAYLLDLLATAARLDPDRMSQSQQVAAYADVIAATSLDALANELRVRWARNWLNDGGPTRWISRLEKMGARKYPNGLASRLELIWGIRHVVVHAAGIATADFVKRHPGFVRAGERVRVPTGNLSQFVHDVGDFVKPTEQFFLARYPSLDVAKSTKQPAPGVNA